MDLHLRVKNSQKYTDITVCLFFITKLKGDEFNGDALSKAVAQSFSHYTYKQCNNKNAKKTQVTAFERASSLNSIRFNRFKH